MYMMEVFGRNKPFLSVIWLCWTWKASEKLLTDDIFLILITCDFLELFTLETWTPALCLWQPNSEEVPLKEFRIPSKESCMQSETEALIEQDLDPPSPAAQASTKQRTLLTDRLDPSIAFPRGTLPRSCSRDSVRSLRRASSLDDIDGMRAEWTSRPGYHRTNSSKCLTGTLWASDREYECKI